MPARRLARGGTPATNDLRERAAREARRVAEMERLAWRTARDRCLQLEKIHRNARRRLAAIAFGSPEQFAGERALAEAALRAVARWEPHDSAAYTILSFAARRDRLAVGVRFCAGMELRSRTSDSLASLRPCKSAFSA